MNDAVLTFGLALLAGVGSQVVARHLRIPGIVLLLLVGVLLGPDLVNVIRPQTLGEGLRHLVGISVAVILFEGGMHLDLMRLRREAVTIRRLVTVGALISGVGATLAARLVMGWEWQVAVPFGALMIVTGPTVITPLLRRIRVRRNLHTILEAEGILIDAIGAIIAVVALEVVLAQELSVAARGLLGIPTRLVFGTACGIGLGYLISRLLASDRIIPDGLESILTLSVLVAGYACCEAILPESGIMAPPIAGMVVGNMPGRPSRELKEFKEQLTVMLVGLLFVLLAADVRLSEVTDLGWRGAATVAILMLIVRPVNVAASTAGSNLTVNEKLFMAWLGPRGIVAAAVASFFAAEMVEQGIADGIQLRALVFLTIATTVVIQGIGGEPVAKILGVRRKSDSGYLIAGAHKLGRALGLALQHGGEEVVLMDSDPAKVAAAREDGLTAIVGNVLDDEALQEAEVESRHGIVGLIPNERVSLMAVEKVRREYRIASASVALNGSLGDGAREQLRAIRARTAFGRQTDASFWSAELAGRAVCRTYQYVGGAESDIDAALHTAGVLPLVIQRRGRCAPVDDRSRLRQGDLITVVHGRDVNLDERSFQFTPSSYLNPGEADRSS